MPLTAPSSTESATPADPAAPAEPSNRAEPSKSGEPSKPAEPSKPGEPASASVRARRAPHPRRRAARPRRVPDAAVTEGQPFPLGVVVTGGGVNVAIYSETAEAVDVCLFDADGTERRVRLPERSGHVLHGFLPGVEPGTRYGLRVHGAWDPGSGLRHNSAKLLLDPWARAVEGEVQWGQAVFSHSFDDPNQREDTDSAASMPRCVVVDDAMDWGDDRPPRVPLAQTVVYEAHVKGLTQRHPDVPEELRGTYAGLATPGVIDYLRGLGVTAVELMPVHAFAQDSHLLEKGLRNFWGYNTMSFLAPHGDYSSAGDGGGQVREFKEMVKALHAAGLEVILDVVFNHTAEGNHMGPTLSLKGIDNGSYYRLVEGDAAHYFDTTGTGNSLNVSHPAALQLIMDSLRYWVTHMHVDGFRFDLATTLTRQGGEADVHSAFLSLVHQDPVLAGVKMIAEPWDTAGYQVGGFPARWSEWNGRYRDDVRDYWRGTEGTLGAMAQRITGSGDIYGSAGRDPLCSVNFVTAHDGYTLADLTAYNDKHNDANGEGGADGESDNRSWNCGAEGPSDDEAVLALRGRQRRNFMASLLLSHGVPMILAGDERGRTQGGNNNAYCQDNEISWVDWENGDDELLEFTRTLAALRHAHPCLRPRHFGDVEVEMRRADGPQMGDGDWEDPLNKALTLHLGGPSSDGADDVEEFLVMLNAAEVPVEFTVPTDSDATADSGGSAPVPAGGGRWSLVLSSDPRQRVEGTLASGAQLLVGDRSLTVLHRPASSATQASAPSSGPGPRG